MGNTGDAEGTPTTCTSRCIRSRCSTSATTAPSTRRRTSTRGSTAGPAVPVGARLGAAGARRRVPRPEPGAILLGMTDISTADGLDPASLERALTPPRRQRCAAARSERARADGRSRSRVAGARRVLLGRGAAVRGRVVAAELVVSAADHVLDPLPRLGPGDRVEEDAERDAGDEQRRLRPLCSCLPCSRSAALRRSSIASAASRGPPRRWRPAWRACGTPWSPISSVVQPSRVGERALHVVAELLVAHRALDVRLDVLRRVRRPCPLSSPCLLDPFASFLAPDTPGLPTQTDAPSGCGHPRRLRGVERAQGADPARQGPHGFTFEAPAGWKVERSARAGPPPRSDSELVQVSTFPLVRPYTDALFAAWRASSRSA